jgi:hypothetical protein
MHPIDEDKPLAILPQYRVKRFYTIPQRLDYPIAEGIAQESARTRLVPTEILEAPRAVAAITFAIVTTKIDDFFWTCAYCAEDPQRSKLFTTRERHLISRKDSTQAITNDSAIARLLSHSALRHHPLAGRTVAERF